jgi:hypothetical protein
MPRGEARKPPGAPATLRIEDLVPAGKLRAVGVSQTLGDKGPPGPAGAVDNSVGLRPMFG